MTDRDDPSDPTLPEPSPDGDHTISVSVEADGGGAIVLHVKGELGVGVSGFLARALSAPSVESPVVIIDLAGADLRTAGAQGLVSAAASRRAIGQSLLVVGTEQQLGMLQAAGPAGAVGAAGAAGAATSLFRTMADAITAARAWLGN